MVVGLGNPGQEYQFTRHNMGFLAVDCFLHRKKLKADEKRRNAFFAILDVGDDEVLFIKPQSFMNRSGRVVTDFAKKFSLSPDEVLVCYDEADLEPERIQLRPGGGSGGHNGIESIFEVWGEREFYRLRIGVGKDTDLELADYLLKPARKSKLEPLAENAANALERILDMGPKTAMNLVNAPKVS